MYINLGRKIILNGFIRPIKVIGKFCHFRTLSQKFSTTGIKFVSWNLEMGSWTSIPKYLKEVDNGMGQSINREEGVLFPIDPE